MSMDIVGPKNWGEYQRACHRMIDEDFDSKQDAYRWLAEKYGKGFHFGGLRYKTDLEKLKKVHRDLWMRSFGTEDSISFQPTTPITN